MEVDTVNRIEEQTAGNVGEGKDQKDAIGRDQKDSTGKDQINTISDVPKDKVDAVSYITKDVLPNDHSALQENIDGPVKVEGPEKVDPVKVEGPEKIVDPVKVEGPEKVVDPAKVEGPKKVVDPVKIEGQEKVDRSVKVDGPESIDGLEKIDVPDEVTRATTEKTETASKDLKVECSGDGDQFTEPEILDPAVLEECQQKGEDDSSEGGSARAEVLGRQRVDSLLDSSSEEDASGGSERKVRRRKKRPKTTDQAAIDRLKKTQEIQDVLSSSPLDIEKLRELAVGDGGLVKDELRRKAWPRLMMIEHMEVTPKPTLEVVKVHKDYQQVVLDVNRSLKRFPPGIDDDYRLVLMDQLTTLIVRVLMKHPDLHYYQGFHDVAITFLLVMGEDVGFEMVEKLAVTHLCDFMRPTMEKTTYYLTYLYPILKRSDPKLHQFLIDSGVGTVFCLPWLITWFAHTLSDYRNVVRLYDFFLATPYLMPMYIAAAIVLKKKEDILSGECDMAMQHFILSQVPDSLPFEEILIEANALHDLYPPNTLQEEVDEFIKKKNEEEAIERQRLSERKKKFEASRRGRHYREMLYAVSRYNPIPPAQTKMIVKVAFFAITAYFATSLYSYYSESPSLFPFSPRQ